MGALAGLVALDEISRVAHLRGGTTWAEAEAQVALLDYAAAMDRFKAAQSMVRSGAGTDHIEASIIDTRTRQVQSLLREQALER